MATSSLASPAKENLFFPQVEVIEHSKLCFDSNAFNNAEFNVEKFLRAARRQATLETVHSDLRHFLQQIQYSMIVLINDDYTDFVKLSSTLASLKDAIVELTNENKNAWKEYLEQIEKIEALTIVVSSKTCELRDSRASQYKNLNRKTILENLKVLLQLTMNEENDDGPYILERMKNLVLEINQLYKNLPENTIKVKLLMQINYTFGKVVKSVFQYCRPPFFEDVHVLHSAISLLQCMGSYEKGLDYLSKNIVTDEYDGDVHDIEQHINWLVDITQSKYNNLIVPLQAETTPEYIRACFPQIICQALVTFFLNYLKKMFPNDFIPSGVEPFRTCYIKVSQFINSFAKEAFYLNLKRHVFEVFNIDAYIRLYSGDAIDGFRSAIDENSLAVTGDPLNFTTFFEYVKAVECILVYSKVLPGTALNVWSLANTLDSDLIRWSKKLIVEVSNKDTVIIEGKPKWYLLTIAAKSYKTSLETFYRVGFDFFAEVSLADNQQRKIINPNFVEDNAVPYVTFFSKHYSRVEKALTEEFKNVIPLLEEAVVAVLIEQFKMVAEIPRQYRWTRAPTPTECSEYVTNVGDLLKQIYELAVASNWEDEEINVFLSSCFEKSLITFASNAEQVLDNITQTVNSLLRLKNKQTKEAARYDADEAKMREQVRIDILTLTKYKDDYKYCQVTDPNHKIFAIKAQFDSE